MKWKVTTGVHSKTLLFDQLRMRKWCSNAHSRKKAVSTGQAQIIITVHVETQIKLMCFLKPKSFFDGKWQLRHFWFECDVAVLRAFGKCVACFCFSWPRCFRSWFVIVTYSQPLQLCLISQFLLGECVFFAIVSSVPMPCEYLPY